VIKDLLYQCYVRKARLQQALVVRTRPSAHPIGS
jgi:hypothetical protein